MRTNIELDDGLIKEAFRLTNVRTKKELIHLALQELIRARKKWYLALGCCCCCLCYKPLVRY
ncbi:type II toxin-antitoxin system VapB family antitoxin [Dolichospermum circinale CS-1225]|uniref:type II toxin-antitoxin system VapB family antitoxin n=1 Tax=Dolichospermum circinale TaxID=109265 RepID=UPI00232C2F67|nr:type II toxin-antitoxin system VapB family antitoxin [Dolichospermum circinale]MDB9521253.1 type II toxin-antitoxin system VapB family antitoxin [Dolichospermum circinale CS-1225]